MSDEKCPWCEAELMLRVLGDAQTCQECQTTWSYEDAQEPELALAA
jgi:transposase-like protein